MIYVIASAWIAALLAAGAAFFAGVYWLEVARRLSSWPSEAKFAAKFTGAAFILGSIAFVVLIMDHVPLG